MGVLRLAKTFGPERLDARERALHINSYTYQSLHSILKNGTPTPQTHHALEQRPRDHTPQHPWCRILPLKKGQKMLTHPTLDTLRALPQDGSADLTHAEWLGLLIDREAISPDKTV